MIRNVQDGDIKTSGLQFVTGNASVGQGVRARLRMFLGESFVDITQGTPWFQRILGKTPQDVAETNIKRRILTAPGVDRIRQFNFDSDRQQRLYQISTVIQTEDGDTEAIELSEGVI